MGDTTDNDKELETNSLGSNSLDYSEGSNESAEIKGDKTLENSDELVGVEFTDQIDSEELSDLESLQYSVEDNDLESLQYSVGSDTDSLQFSVEESDTESLQYSVEIDTESIESLEGENIQELEGDNVSKNLEKDELIGLDIIIDEPIPNEKALDSEKQADLVLALAKLNIIKNKSKDDLDKISKIKEILISRSKSKFSRKSTTNIPNDTKSNNNIANKPNQGISLVELTKPQKTQNMKRKSSVAGKRSNKRRFKKKPDLGTIHENKEYAPKTKREVRTKKKGNRM